MSQITSHVLDITRGRPAQNLPINLFVEQGDGWKWLARSKTDNDGRASELLRIDEILAAGIYRINFNTADYYSAVGDKGFYPYVDIVFELDAGGGHYHIPLLLTAYGYSTYRGS